MIFKLPYVVQTNVIQQMELHEQYFLGLCSKRAKMFIHRMPRRYNATVVNLWSSCIQVQKPGVRGEDVVMWALNGSSGENEELLNTVTSGDKEIELKYKKMKIDCRISYHPIKYIPIFWCDDNHKKVIPLAIHYSICDVLKFSPILQIKCRMNQLADFPDVKEIDNIFECGPAGDREEYAMFFERVVIKNSAKLYAFPSPYFKPESKLLSIDHIYIVNSRWLTRDHLLNFKGRSARFLMAEHIRSDDVIEFIRRWQQGFYEKLELIWINLSYKKTFSRNTILENFDVKSWDPVRRAARFPYPDGTTVADGNDILDLTNEMDIQRPSDGKLATVVISNTEFRFFVWNETFPDSTATKPRSDVWDGREWLIQRMIYF